MESLNFKQLAQLDAESMARCFDSYSKHCHHDEIMDIGYNPNSGYAYIALEDGVQIASLFGNDAQFIVVNYYDGEEYFFDSYDEAYAMNRCISAMNQDANITDDFISDGYSHIKTEYERISFPLEGEDETECEIIKL